MLRVSALLAPPLAVAVALAASLAVAATPGPTPPPAKPAPVKPPAAPATPPPDPNPGLDFYPPAARAAGIEGQAVINCPRNEHLALRGCTLKSETPAGQGFGAAALAMAATSHDNPKVTFDDPARRPPTDFTVKFALHPPSVKPDLTGMGHSLVNPQIVSQPTKAQIQAAYPVRALADGLNGAAIIDCLVGKTGLLGDCVVYAENPSGYGFGAAALELAPHFSLKPRLFDGDPVDGAEVQLPVTFAASGDPDAPLQLKTNP